MQGPMPQEGQAPEQAPQEGGGAAQLLADAHSNLLKLQELMQAKFPEDAQKVAGLVQGIQALAEDLGQSPDAKGPAGQATTTPEAGGADVMPAL